MLAYKTIAENMFAKVYGEGNRFVLFQENIYYRYDGTEVKEQDAFITTHTGENRRRETTNGVEVLV